MRVTPPKNALKFLRWFCREDCLDEIEGDVIELFEKQNPQSSAKARLKFVFTVLRYFRPEYMKIFHQKNHSHFIIHSAMIRNYILLAFRNLWKRTAFSFINIFGLALGISAFLVILHYIEFETSYDSFHVNAESIYRINRISIKNGERLQAMTKTTYGLGPALAEDIPEIKRFVRIHEESAVVSYSPEQGNAKSFHEDDILIVDSTFFRIFSYQSAMGNLATSLDHAQSIVLTQSVAQKYFGHEDPIGKTLKIAGGRMDGSYTVSAVMQDSPPNSHFSFDILLPFSNLLNVSQYKDDDGWGWNNFVTYVQLSDGAKHSIAESKLPDFSNRRLNPKWKSYGISLELHLQPLRDIHLQPGLRHDVETVNPDTIYFFGLIGLFILVIAWINYINLSTARAMERATEVGIKKAIGAFRSELITQFLFESLLINFIAIVAAVGLVVLLLPVLSDVIDKELVFRFFDLRLWFVLSIVFITGVLASGMYPAFVLSSFKITNTLKGKRLEGQKFSLRKTLVVFQFASSLVLVAGTFVVYRQINFMQSADKGLEMEQMLLVRGTGTIKWDEAKQKLAVFKEEIKRIPGVSAVATSGTFPGEGHNWGADIRKLGKPITEMKTGSVVWIDPDFIPAYGIDFMAGKNFDPQLQSDDRTVIINEASLAAFELGTAEEALNEQLIIGEDTAIIKGVLKNYNWSSLKSEYVPFLFLPGKIVPAAISIHLEGNAISSSVQSIEKIYKDLIPEEPFEYSFLDDSFNAQYRSDQQFGNIFGLFASLAIIISCLGLWGLASFSTSQKMKEIGIRKVLGASLGSIIYLLSGQFLRLILIASLVALPIAWLGMNYWLQGFAFKVGVSWDLFVLPVTGLILIALLTVSLQVLKGARMNPVKVLKAE